jgi:hypothetical protein
MRIKVVDGTEMPLTPEEEAQLTEMGEVMDRDFRMTRGFRNGKLEASDWTQIGDAGLGVHTVEEWQTYRQELRDYPAQSDRVSTLPEWPETPPERLAREAEE